jgi:hypothetical protein
MKSLFIIGFCVGTVYFKITSIKKSYNTVSIWVKKKSFWCSFAQPPFSENLDLV